MMRNLWGMIKQSVSDWVDDKAMQLGAALAFYSLLSIAPLLIITIAVAGLVFGQEAAQGQLVGQMRSMVGTEGAEAIETMLANARRPGAGIVATILGVATLLFGASGVFGQLQTSLNTIWEVQPKPGGGFWGFIRTRFLSFAMVLGIGFLLLVSLVLSALLSALGDLMGGLLPGWQIAAQVLNLAVSFGVITLLFAMIFKILPDVKIAWRDVWIGAALTALLFTLGKYLIGLYLAQASPGSTYGAAGSLVVLILWIYYSSLILFFGAEFTQVYAKAHGSQIEPARNAERIASEERLRQGLSATKNQPASTAQQS